MPLGVSRSSVPPQNPAEPELCGQIDNIFKTFDNGDSQTILARLSDGWVVRGAVDDSDELQERGNYLFMGRWDEHPKYGWQFVFSGFVIDIPRGADGAAS
jgi:hypothetical protein